MSDKNASTSTMQTINDAMINSLGDKESLGAALFELFSEFVGAYKNEWTRMANNEKLYHAKHWDAENSEDGQNAPKPVTPIIFSTIENIKADMMDELPCAVIKPERSKDADLSRMLTKVVEQDLDASDFPYQYSLMLSDFLTYGWCVQEVGFDLDALRGKGCGYIRRVAPFGFMCDPLAENLQDGRACFKFGVRTKEWFRQHYPDSYEQISYDLTAVDRYTPDSQITEDAKTEETAYLIEAWVKNYDPETRKTAVHMAIMGGTTLLELSKDVKPEGYYMHGEYPFVLVPLYPVSGTPWGYGIPDMHKETQKYSDKLDQIILKNAYLASHNKLLVTDGSGFDPNDLADWSKDVHSGESLNGISWFSTPPLPSYLMNYLQLMRDSIKTESGANEQSRGQAAGGVTAASAIQALQSMSTKRSRMHASNMHARFKTSVRMLLDVEREFAQSDREITYMRKGELVSATLVPKSLKQIGDDGLPIEYSIIIETSSQTKYSKIANNELALQLGQMFRDTIDPISVLYMMDFQDKDIVIEQMEESRKGQLMQMKQQLAEMSQTLQQMQQENAKYKSAFAKQAGAQAQQQSRQRAEEAAQQPQAVPNAPMQQMGERDMQSMAQAASIV